MSIQRGKVVVVERGERRVRAGQGLLKGLGVVWKHWAGSFKRPQKLSDTSGTFTIEYPEEKRKLPEAYRNMPILLYDDANGQELCTSCFQCQRICPPQVIHMTQAKDPNTGKAVPAVAEFLIEYDACMSCGFCAEACPFDAIKMDHEYELSTAEHPKLTVNKEGLNRPISYYQGIAPGMWDEVKESAYKKLQGNIKRRSGLIGVAPQMVERVRELRKTEDGRPETGASAPTAAPAAPVAPVAAAPAAAPAAKALTAEEKAAKLAAIRAANAAKETGDSSQSAVTSSQPAASAAPTDDKAAKLAAIRAANAAKQTGASRPAPVAEPPAPAAPADDKVAKLAAIRAANAAKATVDGRPETGVSSPAPVAPAPTAPAAPADDKTARLAAIRAANAAKNSGQAPAATAPVVPAAAGAPANGSETNGSETNGSEAPAVVSAAAPADDKAARLAAIRAANAAKKATGGE